jgi:D-mannonate dehydratase
MSDREFAFGQLLATLGPLSEVDVETIQYAFNAGTDWMHAHMVTSGEAGR